ncbi:hypothetical protein Bca52824_089799 [Brassica carinata]|uniref:Zinc finger PHD-type domain-containing protein n=1 Tax=Brassica carinata TaxID=52824 RepID=A0A8X7NRY8_BRACI|nr:hypothetical protein Bca52824_089799 [Brassica carinata]
MTSMVSIIHKDDQIVESKEITPISSPKITYDSNNDELNDADTDDEEVNVCDTCGVLGFKNKLAICDNCGVGAEHTYCMAVEVEDVPERWFCYDCVEDTGSIKQNSKSSIDLFEMGENAFQKQNGSSTQKSSETNMEQMKSSMHPGGENKGVAAENLSSDSEKDISEEARGVDNNNELSDTEEEVIVCDTCGVLGFKHMLVICHNCGVGAEHTYCMAVKLEDVPEKWSCYDCVGDTGSLKKKSKSSIDLFEMGESPFQKQNDLSTQKSSETVGLDLNLDPSIDLNANPNLDLNGDHNMNLNGDHNVDLSLDCGSSYRSSSTSNFQAHTRMRASPNPLLGQGSLEEEEEDQCAKRRRVDTQLSL